MLLGAQSANAWYLRGSFNSWGTGANFGGDNWCSVSLTAGTDYYFEISGNPSDNTGDNFGKKNASLSADGTIDNLVYKTDGNFGSFKVVPSVTGNYYFRITAWYGDGKPKAVEVVFPEQYTARTGLTVNNYGTICLAKKAVSVTGATLYSIFGKDADTPTELYLVAESAPFEAGRPYIYKASATSIVTNLEGFSTSAGSYKGLYGTFEESLSVVSTNENPLYILSNNTVVKAGTGCTIGNGRAYIKMKEVDVTDEPSAPSAIRFDLEENNATDIDAIEASKKAVKFIENGQMYILRNGVKYDATGRVVK